MRPSTVALRVDVDTWRGFHEGVPRLLELFRHYGVRASFFVTMGPDRSGAALRRAWRPSFVVKMLRSRAWRLYGLRTVLSGTLLPPRPVGSGDAPLLRQIGAEGHEVGPHGWDHVGWQDRVHRLGSEAVRRDLAEATRAVEAALGTRPASSAAPGWRTTPEALAIQEEFGYRYASDVRGRVPFRPLVGGGVLKTIQIPTTMPTMDELLGRVRDIARALEEALRPGLNVLTAHAEVEGGPLLPAFRTLLDRLAGRRIALGRVDHVVEALLSERAELPALPVVRARAPGRSGWVAVHAARVGD